MLVNTLTTETGHRVFLLDQVFEPQWIDRLHQLCDSAELGSDQWAMPDWTQGRPRYMFDCKGTAWQEIETYINSDEFLLPLANIIGHSLRCTAASIWADLAGFGPLGPHKEGGGNYMMQVYITKTDHPYTGTTIYNEAGQVLAQLPYRDNFAWLFHGMQVMHGRYHDVPEGLRRFTFQIWFDKPHP